MYTPKQFAVDDLAELSAFMQHYNFAVLVTALEGQLMATHLPFMLDTERGEHGTLIAHMARANPQWQAFNREQEVLVIFSGPHAYVSPSWYEAAPTNVPTWNYTAVHAYGVPTIIDDHEAVYAMLGQLVHEHEAHFQHPWSMQSSEDSIRNLISAIVAFEIPITRLEGKYKLSQNRPTADQFSVAAHLFAGDDTLAAKTAEMMRTFSEPHR
jgi:transcriptional regulator